ncbi:UDP-N-acetylmuramate dehydrogenase [Candidatus Saccharibacteria bacterium]|nr:UDP-N-acetylmuramate dehydrogenase [Candidatus Saccharibacteria bacterium]
MRISENILISSLTTMRLGGPARYVIEIEAPEEIPSAYAFAASKQLPTFVLGYGANTIGHDEGFNGVIIINRLRGIIEKDATSTSDALREESPSKTVITVMGGEYWDDVVAYACERQLTGIEALSKIPGLTAAAPVQNIGAYGQDISDTLTEIYVYDTTTSTFKTLTKSELGFSYRRSILNSSARDRYFVISITLELHRGQMPRPFYNSIENYISEHHLTDFTPQGIRQIVSTIRAAKLPDPLVKASSGSFFKNVYLDDAAAALAESKGYPVHHGKDGHKINSGWLIEQAGFKGQLLYGFRVNEQATLVLINESATSYADLAKARSAITSKVYDQFGYWLEQEPVEITQP